ncbi:MAG: hypothetical protein F4120_10120 [Rhodothermaceae bacterium]|nr:hypothetical protein [Rhodothermaceae bacterium]MXW31584.1 hypothetical protein [Rhodothermaceae bacterium]MXZ17990.1 hypothetical protein [Rhodothermaceae bacterium]MYC05546.1 hypothetical protein [Rhodothermaceae bacterium]MYE62735.1 hypothetical protein [Rhodothermaceae bacterium]
MTQSVTTWMIRSISLSVLIMILVPVSVVQAQFINKWLSAGSLHNWYSEIGNECESCGFVGSQQDGLRWPGIYRLTDMQAAKALWIGAVNVTDDLGTNYARRVVHAGPRVSGGGEFFPTRFELISRLTPTTVLVDGAITEPEAAMVADDVDPSIDADAMIIGEANTLLGITMERKILQFTQEYHDNYHILEYTFTNTGNVDDDPDIELPNQTLEGVYFFFQWRLSVSKETRYVIGNGTGWGLNAMLDTRGDGVKVDPPDEDFRAQFVWHGKFPPFNAYDNIGGPILPQALPAFNIAPTDTTGRLGASQFAGIVTIHADTSPSDHSDDPDQPSTTSWIGSDEPYQSQNDAFNPAKMEVEYGVMSAGHKSPRHADVVEPTGLPGFLNPVGDPSLGTPGGFSNANGYGPYTLAPGERIRIVMAEAASGLSREANSVIGRAYKESVADDSAPITYEVHGQSHTMTKNEWVFTSRDSLFQTFRRAIANYASGYTIPRAPAPPSIFEVDGGGDRIRLTWSPHETESLPEGWEIYRAQGRYDSTYTLVHTASGVETSFDDTTPIRGIDYYYYIAGVQSASQNDGTGLTPSGRALRSSRYATQTYTPTRLKRPAGTALSDVRIVPNPFNIASSPFVRFPDQTDKLAFFNIPGRCTIAIYTDLGELVDEIEHTDGSGDEFWDHTTSSRQIVSSGVYIAVITDLDTGERIIKKFVIIR